MVDSRREPVKLETDADEARVEKEPEEVFLFRMIWEMCRRRGEGAPSSSLSLHPKPVVRPKPRPRFLPSR